MNDLFCKSSNEFSKNNNEFGKNNNEFGKSNDEPSKQKGFLGKIGNTYYCNICDITTNYKTHYDIHVLTSKHEKKMKQYKNMCENIHVSQYECLCGKGYKYRQGLFIHKKKCEYKEKTVEINATSENEENKHPTMDPDIVKELMKQNQYLIMENQDFKKMMMELISKPAGSNNNTTINTNSHNKQFNLQFFLNETCKNAMNLSDFVNSIVIQASELEDMGKLGYVQGISNIMIRSLKELDETERPFHCTDKKREVIYIKENNVWEKETSDRAKLYQFVKDIAYRNFKRMPQWEKDNPKYDDITTKKHLEYIRMLNQVMTGLGPEEIGVNKIIRNLSAHVYLDK